MAQSKILEDAHLEALLAEAETSFKEEMEGRTSEWPTTAALAYWHMAETCRRFLHLPHAH